MIEERKKQRKESGENAANQDLLDLILEADQEGVFSTEELVQNTFLLFLAGMS